MIFRPYQNEAHDSVFDFFASHKTGNPLVAMPTGTGKSLVIGKLITTIMQSWPNQRIMTLTHVKELIKQNSDKLAEIWPVAPYGIYSAGLKKKQTHYPVTFGGVASVVKRIKEFGHIDIVLIDEVHLFSNDADSMYQVIIFELMQINPLLRLIGTTATPYRLGTGLLTNSGLFTDICFDITGLAAFNKLIADGYLSPLITKKTVSQVDISDVGLGSDGDFNKSALEQAFDKNDLNYQICQELIEYGHTRSTWLLFAAGIKHSEHIAEMLRNFGISCAAIHSKTTSEYRDSALEAYKAGTIRCLVNNNVLTTGFDHPAIDFIGMLRPTTSTGLWVQMAGRGTRPSPLTMKQNCLVLDFAGNTQRLGPINDPIIPRPKGQGKPGVAPIKICPACGVYNHATASTCCACGYEFPQNVNLNDTATSADILVSDSPVYEWFNSERVIYKKHVPDNRPPVLKVIYICGRKQYAEYICIEHSGYAGQKAEQWWKKRMGSSVAPPTVDEALPWTFQLKTPKRILVWTNKKHPEIVSQEF
jgi:DNA repair protein RadD